MIASLLKQLLIKLKSAHMIAIVKLSRDYLPNTTLTSSPAIFLANWFFHCFLNTVFIAQGLN